MESRKLLYWLIILITACNTDEPFSDGFIDTHYARTVLIDSTTIETSTVILDSIPTSGQERILMGKLSNDAMGSVIYNSFFSIGDMENFGSFEPTEEAKVDSIEMILDIASFSGDTSSLFSFYLFQLEEELDFIEDEFSLYNTSNIPYRGEPLASYRFIPTSLSEDRLHIKLPISFGDDILEQFIQKSSSVDDVISLVSYLKGFVMIVADEHEGGLVNFSATTALSASDEENPSPFIRLYYSDDFNNEIPTGDDGEYVDLRFTNANRQFNQIQLQPNEKGLALTEVSSFRDRVASPLTSDQTFVVPGAGVYTRIDFPYLKLQHENMGEDAHITAAKLIISPAKGSFPDVEQLPPSLTLIEVDDRNNFGFAVAGSFQENAQFAFLQVDYEFDKETYYEFDLTEYLATGNFFEHGSGLLVNIPNEDPFRLQYVLPIAGQGYSEATIEFEIYYSYFF